MVLLVSNYLFKMASRNSFKVLVVTDSRAVDLKNFMEDWGDIELTVVPAPSMGIESEIDLLISQKKNTNPDMVLVMNGICDILVKNKITRKYFLAHESVDELTAHYLKQVEKGLELLDLYFGKAKKMFNPVTGADVSDYNNTERKKLKGESLAAYHRAKIPDPLQPVLNAAVLQINTEIVKINKGNSVYTPYTATFVHKHYGGAYHHSYQYTSDGCHLTEEGKRYWAQQVKKAITKTRKQADGAV